MMRKITELNSIQIEGLRRAIALDWIGTTIEDILLDVGSGGLDCWVPEGADDSVVITQIVIRPAGRQLTLLLVGGRGILKVIDDAGRDLVELAKANRCSWIQTEAFRPGWTRMAERLGFHARATIYLMEINDGQG